MTRINKDRDQQVLFVIAIEGTINVCVLALKAVAGLTTGSMAILADAIHSLTDVINNFAAWAVVRISNGPPDHNHPYGHRKFETLAVFALASLLVVLAVELVLHAVHREQPQITQSRLGLVLMGLVLVLNIGVTIWQRHKAKTLNSDILMADASHTLSDVLTTIVVIAGWQLSTLGYGWIDTIGAIAVGGFVLYLAYDLFRRAIPVLVDQVSVEPELVVQAISEIKGVRSVRRVRSRWIGMERAMDLVVGVDPAMSTAASHRIADSIEALLEERFQVNDITVHIEPDAANECANQTSD